MCVCVCVSRPAEHHEDEGLDLCEHGESTLPLSARSAPVSPLRLSALAHGAAVAPAPGTAGPGDAPGPVTTARNEG